MMINTLSDGEEKNDLFPGCYVNSLKTNKFNFMIYSEHGQNFGFKMILVISG